MQFEPFQDRLSRDIRNDLAASLVKALQEGNLAPVLAVAARYQDQDIAPCYTEYIQDRITRYRAALAEIRQGSDDVFFRALVLWDLRLFFEVHEILEPAWLKAAGGEKLFLQALIRAAGVYIKLEYGYRKGAEKMAQRALPVLAQYQDLLARYCNPEKLLHALRDITLPPPLLLAG